ncbi:MAG: glycosyltransferase [Candidatus Stygibacter frigidus]|nr:glycosyltransferase [Candidatus Stygibacter frigidus]
MITFSFVLIIIILASAFLLYKPQNKNPQLRTFSILIACRNEENNIPELIESLQKINYPAELWQVIIVDDASEDNTWQLLQPHIAKLANFKIYRLKEKSTVYKGKKAALKLAAENADFDYLLFTDADCIVHPEILHSYSELLTANTDAAIGWYLTKTASPLQRIIDVSSGVTFALTTKMGIPFSASGMNWVVSKNAFIEVDGYEKIKHKIAGDDKLLLLLVKALGNKIAFNHRFPVQTKLPQGSDSQRLMRKYGKLSSSPFNIKLIMLILGAFYIYLPWQIIIQGYEIGLIYLAGLFLFWMIVLLRFSLKFKLSDPLLLMIAPYILFYHVLRGSFGNWEWKGQKRKSS